MTSTEATDKTEDREWPAGSEAWFVCRAKSIVDDVMLPIRDQAAGEANLAKKGRMAAARIFKRRHGLHPCVKVDVEFQAVETPAVRAAMEANHP